MVTNIKMGKFLKTNVLDTISRKYKYDPELKKYYKKLIYNSLTS